MVLTALLGLSFATHQVEAHIVAASMFKNGYSVVMREVEVPAAGDYSIARIPSASMGTLWFAASAGTSLDSVETVDEPTDFDYEISQLDGLLSANKGKEVRLGMKNGDAVTGDQATGTIVSVGSDVVLLQTKDKGMLAIPRSSITSIAATQGEPIYKVKSQSTHRALKLHVTGKSGKISMVSLERGLTWSPGYAVDISDKAKLSITAKATVLNDLEPLKDIDAKFVTGFPNVPFMDIVDPLVSGQSVDQFLGFMSSPVGLAGAGGFGGQGYAPRDARMSILTQNAAMASPAMVAGENVPMSRLAGQQLEDLFFYRQGSLSLGKGDRGNYILFRSEAPYKEIYTWDNPNPIFNDSYRPQNQEAPPDEVWHALQFKNSSGRPLTTAPATTFKEGQILGQDTLNYTSPNGDAELKITKALDVLAESSEEEVTRERGAIKNSGGYPIFDLVTLKGILQVTNRKADPVNLRIRRDFSGELVAADGLPVVKKTAKGLRETNPSGQLTWTKLLQPGQKLSLNYTYKVYIHTQ